MEALGFILLLIVSFLSSIIGTMIGTAMLILPPAMIFLGMPVHTAVATARFSMIGMGIGNLTKFSLKQRIELKYVAPFAAAGAIGSLISALMLRNINEAVLKPLIGFLMIVISVLILFEESIRQRRKAAITHRHHFLSVLGGLFVGSYIGIVGGGGATIVIFLLILIYGLSFHDAIANQKAITLPMTLVATIVFVAEGLIDYRIGVPLLVINTLGGFMGAWAIMKFRGRWLKWILVPVIIAMALRLILSSVTITK